MELPHAFRRVFLLCSCFVYILWWCLVDYAIALVGLRCALPSWTFSSLGRKALRSGGFERAVGQWHHWHAGIKRGTVKAGHLGLPRHSHLTPRAPHTLAHARLRPSDVRRCARQQRAAPRISLGQFMVLPIVRPSRRRPCSSGRPGRRARPTVRERRARRRRARIARRRNGGGPPSGTCLLRGAAVQPRR